MTTTRGERRALNQQMQAIIAESRRTAAKAARVAQLGQSELPGLEQPHPPRPKGQSARIELPERVAELVYSLAVHRRLDELVLEASNFEQISEFIEEFADSALLRAHSLEPRHTLLLVGPPGNGKTSLAEALATELSLPLLALRYDAIVDSFLGETSNRLRRLIEYATLNPCVLFFDEFDAVGKERSDAQETGEIKRVVSSLLMQMDRLPSHTLVICATNHPELLDRAVWRRFELKMLIDRPNRQQLLTWFERFAQTLDAPTGISAEEFADVMAGENMSAVEAFTLDVRRKLVLARGKLTTADAVALILKRGKLRLVKNEVREQPNGIELSDHPPGKSVDRRTRKGTKARLSPQDPV